MKQRREEGLIENMILFWRIQLFFLFGMLTFVEKSDGFLIKHTSITPNEPAQIGTTVKLSCQSDSFYEYCVWRHKNRVCNFEWKSSHGAVKKQSCSQLQNRAHFVGSYSNHQCAIELSNVPFWFCSGAVLAQSQSFLSTHKG